MVIHINLNWRIVLFYRMLLAVLERKMQFDYYTDNGGVIEQMLRT